MAPYSDADKRKEYLKLYMRAHRQLLTPEQKRRKAEKGKAWRQENAERLAEYQRNRKDKEKVVARKKQFAREHPEIIQARSKKYYDENKEAIKNAVKERRNNNLKAARATASRYRVSFRGRFQSYKASAKKRGLGFSLTFEQFCSLLRKPCHYCPQEKAMGVDRLDSASGIYSTTPSHVAPLVTS